MLHQELLISHTNEFYALTVTSEGYLAAVSEKGMLIAKYNIGSAISDRNGLFYSNLLSYPHYKYFPMSHEQNNSRPS